MACIFLPADVKSATWKKISDILLTDMISMQIPHQSWHWVDRVPISPYSMGLIHIHNWSEICSRNPNVLPRISAVDPHDGFF